MYCTYLGSYWNVFWCTCTYIRTCLKGPWVWSICFPCTYASILELIWLLCLAERWLSVQYVCTNTCLALVNDSSSVQLDQQQKSHAERMKKKNIQITGLQKVSKLSHFSTRCGMLVTWYCVQLSWSQTPEGIHTCALTVSYGFSWLLILFS